MNAGLQIDALSRRMHRAARAGQTEQRRQCERELVRRYQSDPSCRAAVAEAFRPFATSFARKLKRGEEPLEDLTQVALFGLLKALERFDPSRGDSFTGYAAPTVLGELRRHYRNTGWAVHVPRGKQELAQKVNRGARELTARGVEPTVAELAAHLEMSVEDIVEGRISSDAMRANSLDRPVRDGESEGASELDLHGEIDDGYDRAEDRAVIAGLAADLPERDRMILALRFSAELPQSRIGEIVGVSQMQVSRELRRIMDDLHEVVAPDR